MSERLFVLVTYDVMTLEAAGRKRLRRVAKICEAHGQRVQKSVFECKLTLAHLEEMERKLLKAMNEKEDSLRIYRLSENARWNVKQYGCFQSIDFDAPLVL